MSDLNWSRSRAERGNEYYSGVLVRDPALRCRRNYVVLFTDGAEIPAHEAFWFAWSQFQRQTLLWER